MARSRISRFIQRGEHLPRRVAGNGPGPAAPAGCESHALDHPAGRAPGAVEGILDSRQHAADSATLSAAPPLAASTEIAQPIARVSVDRGAGTALNRRQFLSLPLLLSPLLATPAYAAAKISGTRVWPASEYTRVTFESPTALKYTHFFVKEPERLVIDIENVELGPALKELADKIGKDDPFIQAVRVGVNRANVIRVVLDLKVEVKPQVFAVPPAGEFGHRLMLDIYPAKASDPMLALLNEDVAAFGKNAGSDPGPAEPAAGVPGTIAKAPEAPAIIANRDGKPDNAAKTADGKGRSEEHTSE